MTETTGAAAPASEQAAPAPAASEQAPSGMRDLDEVVVPEKEPEPKTETIEAETATESEPEGEDQPRRLTRNQRLQRKAARLSTMVAEQAAKIEELSRNTAKADAESEPKEADYNGDWTKYQADYAAWKATKNIRGVLDEQRQQDVNARVAERRQEAADEFQERAEQLKSGIPDFDQTIEAFAKAGGKFAPHVIEELLESDKGPLLAYNLAKNPFLASELNGMSPRDVAREIGRLEAKTALPQPKKQTQAPAPLTQVTGGSVPPAKALGDLSMRDYIAARKKQNAEP